ncbi:unnamed protein product [Eruca vesicaria subsp. sativa]|uniref:Uncharacterized protein n=1 Tax=Eruca vesicaria subsp. sativa TaxID=29727 RepID=A0ABC8LKX2_ERUVS|nr:unnamed protein product [Eruca vesicaria subsp. sativa]
MTQQNPIPSVMPIRRSTTAKKLKRAGEFTIADVRMCLSATSNWEKKEKKYVFKNARLRELTKNPYGTIRRYQEIMKNCLKHNNGDAHYVEGIKQYFDFNNP